MFLLVFLFFPFSHSRSSFYIRVTLGKGYGRVKLRYVYGFVFQKPNTLKEFKLRSWRTWREKDFFPLLKENFPGSGGEEQRETTLRLPKAEIWTLLPIKMTYETTGCQAETVEWSLRRQCQNQLHPRLPCFTMTKKVSVAKLNKVHVNNDCLITALTGKTNDWKMCSLHHW